MAKCKTGQVYDVKLGKCKPSGKRLKIRRKKKGEYMDKDRFAMKGSPGGRDEWRAESPYEIPLPTKSLARGPHGKMIPGKLAYKAKPAKKKKK